MCGNPVRSGMGGTVSPLRLSKIHFFLTASQRTAAAGTRADIHTGRTLLAAPLSFGDTMTPLRKKIRRLTRCVLYLAQSPLSE